MSCQIHSFRAYQQNKLREKIDYLVEQKEMAEERLNSWRKEGQAAVKEMTGIKFALHRAQEEYDNA